MARFDFLDDIFTTLKKHPLLLSLKTDGKELIELKASETEINIDIKDPNTLAEIIKVFKRI